MIPAATFIPAVPSDDFPAAHSMDTTWFGVDDLGNIALFDTGEGGAYPRALELPCFLTVTEGHTEVEAELKARALEFITYEQDSLRNRNLPGPYDREKVPDAPANVRDLSPEACACVEKGRLPGANFLEMPSVQPAEHVPCDVYENPLDFIISADRRYLTFVADMQPVTPERLEWCRGIATKLNLELILLSSPEGGEK